MHSLVLGFPIAGRHHTDHIDRNKLNNQKGNLRRISAQLNLMNSGRQKNNTSGYKGVKLYRRKAGGPLTPKPWTANISKTTDGKQKYFSLGYYATAEEAARAYDAKAKQLYGDYAVLNFPEPPHAQGATA